MLPSQLSFTLAIRSLLRNRLQTVLAMLGVSVGVCALVTSLALGHGAQHAVAEQLRAAGANVILVNAGNYQIRREQQKDSAAGDESWLDEIPRPRWDARRTPRAMPVHYEDDPTALHDHPTAKERLGDASAGLGAAATLTREDAAAIRRDIAGIQYVASGIHENVRVYAGTDTTAAAWFTRLHGTEAELAQIRPGWALAQGEFLTADQVADGRQVMVLGQVVAERLFGAADPVGRRVLMWNQLFTITGVIGSRNWVSQPAPGDDQFDAVYVPVTTVQRLLNLSKLNTITVTSRSVGDTTAIAKQIVTLLRRRHRIGEGAADDFTVKTQAQQVLGHGLPPALARVVAGNMTGVDQITIERLSMSLQRANRTLLGLLTGAATVALVVGGVGVMNLLLLSVTQRTREIGVRIALGARQRDVAAQFVFEAIALSLVGGVIGILAGTLVAIGLGRAFHWSTSVSPASALLGLLSAAALGSSFGVYPARRAAQLDPIEALRHE